jgi:hypothetical protein
MTSYRAKKTVKAYWYTGDIHALNAWAKSVGVTEHIVAALPLKPDVWIVRELGFEGPHLVMMRDDQFKAAYEEEIPKKFDIIVIAGLREITQMFQAFDIFEKFKVIAQPEVIEATCDPDADPDIPKITCALRTGMEKRGFRVVAVFVPGNPAGSYVDETVKVISNGTSWTTLENCLKALNYVAPAVEVTEKETVHD